MAAKTVIMIQATGIVTRKRSMESFSPQRRKKKRNDCVRKVPTKSLLLQLNKHIYYLPRSVSLTIIVDSQCNVVSVSSGR